jgi:hypothetical protein
MAHISSTQATPDICRDQNHCTSGWLRPRPILSVFFANTNLSNKLGGLAAYSSASCM